MGVQAAEPPFRMTSEKELLVALGQRIRSHRGSLTQAQLGKRSGLGPKYVSEIERGTRDVPISTLQAIVERGLGLRLDVQFAKTARTAAVVALPPPVEQVARLIADLKPEQRTEVISVIRGLVRLAAR